MTVTYCMTDFNSIEALECPLGNPFRNYGSQNQIAIIWFGFEFVYL